MSKCRSCNAEISWVKTKSGKSMPVNQEYIEHDKATPGTVLVTDNGDTIMVKENISLPATKGRVSHFATCPQGDTWRQSTKE